MPTTGKTQWAATSYQTLNPEIYAFVLYLLENKENLLHALDKIPVDADDAPFFSQGQVFIHATADALEALAK